ncbi:MarR family winged helix-turn-helix transcriptional regulator [uncultured Cocleimonas sp.]|uniref:MarR family winged helix-turn-helix transcriptional regulator n=1 Tax=uncultured Cocleimonas sp. TaxID=1051587 RepID=UPI00260D07CA|nr:MarR family transcriptional regulator [uncultured Cocleimonas sp.]
MSKNHNRKADIAKPHLEEEIFMSAIALGDRALAESNKLLSIWGMTALQYNALKVLYVEDSKGEGLPSMEIGQRLYTRVPDVTRLLERMVDKGWVTRERDLVNKRVVRSKLTDIGIQLVESAYLPLRESDSKQLEQLTDEEKTELARLLNKAKTSG